ncbi:UDP-glucose 4-epimerase [Psychrobacillus sp. OK028]|uniref:NAD-dependent epimerase/dehydratase family protein n=1 Tax=Psychrobacillus sp. OK028 TaxID=1884359 RepID=UPI00087E8196|nr:NAD-dependent epimerase/dehydratase family protein [Psychrobacillus sp. OK028]SDO00794.1 UDP-glucose 4-epimerase [Psychrobacillus sp. OK028]
MKVLVTGAAGFIGSYVVQALLEKQIAVTAVDNLSNGSLTNLPENISFYEIDITKNELETVFQIESPDYVIHLAAQSSVIQSMNNPVEDCQANLFGTLNILRYSRQYEVKKCVIASTAAVYGNPTKFPVYEDNKLSALSFYALSKLSAEKYAQLYEKLFDVKSSILRFSNVFGPKQPNGVITSLIQRLIEGETPIIYDGKQTRDFIYVKDVAHACIQSMLSEQTGIFNISSNRELSIKQLYKEISDLMGVHTEPDYKVLREGEIERSVLSNSKAIATLEWSPIYRLEEGLKETIQHYVNLNHI